MYHIKNIPADYWLILCLLITDPLPASAFAANVICYILLYPVTVQMAVFTIVTLFIFICEVGCVCVLRGNDLHSTMFIFICSWFTDSRTTYNNLHSTMFIFIWLFHLPLSFLYYIYIPLCLYLYLVAAYVCYKLHLIYIPLCLYLYGKL